MNTDRLLRDSLFELGLEPSEEAVQSLCKYLELIKEWNAKINITSITEDAEIISKHFVDSLAASKGIKFSDQRIADIGSGAGLPGLPLKIIFPDLEVHFIESSSKKAKVIESICSDLGIQGCFIINDNVYNICHRGKYRENFDLCVCRAFGSLKEVLELGIPLIKVFGELVIYKGPNVDAEVENSAEALVDLNAEIRKTIDICLPFTDFQRKIIIVEKLWKTKAKFPRRIDKIKNTGQ